MTGWAIETLVATTLMMLVVLALRGPVRRAFGAGVAYLLWLLPLARMALPPLPASWRETAASPLPHSFTPIARASDTITVLVVKPLGLGDAAAPVVHHLSLGLVFAGLWAAGAAAFFLWHWAAHVRFCRRMLASAMPSDASAPGIHVIESDAATGPLAFGVLRRYVAFPRDFADRYDDDERALALAHELGHHARGDLLANWAALVVLAIHWFNPVAWRAFRAFRADQEMANDARVLRGRDPAFRHAYACAIIKSAHGGAISAACHLHTIHALKGRLKMLSSTRKSRRRVAGGAATVGVLMLTGLGLTASGTQAAEGIRAKVCKSLCHHLSQPVVAMAMAAPAPVATAEPAVDAPPQTDATDAKDVTDVTDATPVAAVDTVPHAPPVPQTALVPPVPPVPPVPALPAVDGKAIEASVDHALADMPEVSSRNCGGNDARQVVINDQSGGRNRIVICNDRIARLAARGAMVDTAAIERNAYRSALSGLQTARDRVSADATMGKEARREAVASIDDSISEMQDDLAHVGEDD